MGPQVMSPAATRLDGWEQRLDEAVQMAFQRPFEWSVHDCPTWAFGVRASLTGIDDTPLWRGQYQSLLSGLRLMRRLGWADYAAMGMALLGPARAFPLTGQRGDIALGSLRTGFGVVLGAQVIGLSPNGPVRIPLEGCAMVWRV